MSESYSDFVTLTVTEGGRVGVYLVLVRDSLQTSLSLAPVTSSNNINNNKTAITGNSTQ